MPSGENSTADSLTKMHSVLSEQMLIESSRMSSANWQRAQRMAFGEHCKDTDFKSDEMILVDSTVTITNNASTPAPASPESLSHRTDPAFPTKTPTGRSAGTLAKLAIGAALTASGVGVGAGIPLLLSGGKDVVEAVAAPNAATVPATAPVTTESPQAWTLELEGGR